MGKNPFVVEPKWFMNNNELRKVETLEILGNIFNTSGTASDHINHCITKCRKSYYSLSPTGMLYPGASTKVQCYLYKIICQPTLSYGIECMNVTDKQLCNLDSTQGKL